MKKSSIFSSYKAKCKKLLASLKLLFHVSLYLEITRPMTRNFEREYPPGVFFVGRRDIFRIQTPYLTQYKFWDSIFRNGNRNLWHATEAKLFRYPPWSSRALPTLIFIPLTWRYELFDMIWKEITCATTEVLNWIIWTSPVSPGPSNIPTISLSRSSLIPARTYMVNESNFWPERFL